MPPSSLRQKLGLVAFGLCLAVLTLEAALRLGGFIILSLQEHHNAVSLRQKGAYRILCIGESTTEGAYPAFLEQALNGRNLGIRFSVIDRGLSGSNSSFLVDRIESDLDADHPDMVVAMMGINEYGPHMPYEPETRSKIVRFIRALRTYKLARIAGAHIARAGHRAKEAPHGAVESRWETIAPKPQPAQAQDMTDRAPNHRNNEPYMDLGYACRNRGDYAGAAAAFKKALKANPRRARALVELAAAYQHQGRHMEAAAILKKALGIDPSDGAVYIKLGRCYKILGKYAQAVTAFKRASEINPGDATAYQELGPIYRDHAQFAEAADAFKKARELEPKDGRAYSSPIWASLWGFGNPSQLQKLEISLAEGNPPTDRTYGALATLYAAIGDHGRARQYHEKAEQLRLGTYDQVVADNYHRLKAMLDRRGIKLVCVQYPMLALEPLRKIFRGHAGGIVFVDNEKAFKDAVKGGSLQEYFTDMFAGDFGHCTEKGNKLLAGNIADVLAREVFRK